MFSTVTSEPLMIQPIDQEPDSTLEQDDRFPSGPWEGYFLQPGMPGRHGMELRLTFRAGTLQGEGRDLIGDFLIKGGYDRDSGKCWWSKRYLGLHDVAYLGYNEGRGIWGVWEITVNFKGGFHIWPLGQGSGEGEQVSEEVDTPILIGAGGPGLGMGASDSSDATWD